jgi:superfamily II DNA/RNA helicase
MTTSFSELGAAPFFVERLAERGISAPTEIQRRVIPPLLAGESLLFSSATGTGKTFAYLIPLLQSLLFPPAEQEEAVSRKGWPRVLICAPTYELCSQIKGEADFLLAGGHDEGPLLRAGERPAAGHDERPLLRAGLVIGAAALGRQIDGLKKERPPVIIGNPGRLLQLARMGKLRLGAVEALVLDEGDRLAAEELFEETAALIALVNPRRITAACSATLSPRVRERLMPFMGEGPRVEAAGGGEVLRGAIEHWALFSEERRKIGTLRSLLEAAKPRKALVFAARGAQVGNILSQLQYHHLPAGGLHGDMDRKARKQALEDFRRDRTRILVTSDLASRGLDIPGISHIIALDVPQTGDPYIHRAGRTGRAGNRGIMVTIGDEDELRRLANLEKKLGIIIYPKELYQGRVMAPLADPEDEA